MQIVLMYIVLEGIYLNLHYVEVINLVFGLFDFAFTYVVDVL